MTWDYVADLTSGKEAVKEIEEYLTKHKKAKLALDTEGFNPSSEAFPSPYKKSNGDRLGEIALIQLGADPRLYDKQWLFDVRMLGDRWIESNLKDIIENTTILGQNLSFDFGFLLFQFNIFPKTMRDTMLISQILNAGDKMTHSLANLYRKYLHYGWFTSETTYTFDEYEKVKKEMQISNWKGNLSTAQLQYGADDVRLIFFLYEKMLEELDKFIAIHKKKGIYEVIKLECDLIPEYTLMQMRGMDFNKEYHSTVIDYLTIKSNEAYKEVGKYFTHLVEKNNGRRGKAREKWFEEEPINIKSPKQILEALQSAGLPAENTSEDEIKRLRVELEFNSPMYKALTALIQAKKAESLLSKFGQKYLDLVYEDGRLHPSIHQIGSMYNGIVTGRSSSSNPNIQQIPMRDLLFGEVKAGDLFRKAFDCLPGYKLIVLDYSQIEPRCTSQVTKDDVLIKEFQNPEVDLHALTAKALLSLTQAPLKGSYEREYIGKTANLAMSYGIGASKLAKFMYDETIDNIKPVKWAVSDAKNALKKYYSMFSGIKYHMDKMRSKVDMNFEEYSTLSYFKNKRPLFTEFTLMGRPRRWYLNEIQERMAKENSYKLAKAYTETVFEKDADGKMIQKTTSEFIRTSNKIAMDAYNFKIQGSCADILKLAVLKIGRKLREVGLNILEEGIIAVIHDEIVCRVREENAEWVEKLMREVMIEVARIFIKVVPIQVGGGIGRNWAECKG